MSIARLQAFALVAVMMATPFFWVSACWLVLALRAASLARGRTAPGSIS